MPITEIEKMLEEVIEHYKNKDECKTDFLKCLLEISKTNNINGHKYVYAIVESLEEDKYYNPCAVVRIYLNRKKEGRKMKIIDLINKINNNEAIPEKVKYEATIFEYSKKKKDYIHKVDDWCSETLLFKVMNTYFISDLLRTEVEVIEENKKIEEIEISEKDRKMHSDYINNIADKLNELIKKLNKEREEK